MSGTERTDRRNRVLVVGSTGVVGSRVVDHLRRSGHEVHALVREGGDVSALTSQEVHVVEGDLTAPDSLSRAIGGMDAVVTTAQGYGRRPTDSLATVDDQGNRNLADAASDAGVSRFVFTSILKCDLAVDVPHFYQKKLVEDYLAKRELPFVSLRPGAFLGGNPWMRESLLRGELAGMGPENVPWTYIHPDDVARSLAAAVDLPDLQGQKIDLGMDRAVTRVQLADVFTAVSGRQFRLPPPSGGGTWRNLSQRQIDDFTAMAKFFATGKYVADTTKQAKFFPPVPTVEATVSRVIDEFDLKSGA
jgi:uncharacterized protein YbjT (DUF2867 family)